MSAVWYWRIRWREVAGFAARGWRIAGARPCHSTVHGPLVRSDAMAAPANPLRDYCNFTCETPIHPEAGSGSVVELGFLALSLAGEAGEVADEVKKAWRIGSLSPERRGELFEELGDVLWYWARLCAALGFDPEAVLDHNREKLLARRDAGTLKERANG